MNTNFKVIGLTRLGIEPQVYRIRSGRPIPLGHLNGKLAASHWQHSDLAGREIVPQTSLTDNDLPLRLSYYAFRSNFGFNENAEIYSCFESPINNYDDDAKLS